MTKVVIVGGAGHVGLPLGIAMASRGIDVVLCDRNRDALQTIAEGRMPFIEYGAEPLLKEAIRSGKLKLEAELSCIAHEKPEFVIVCIGTPVDKYSNPETKTFLDSMEPIAKQMGIGTTLIIRSTVFPGTMDKLSCMFPLQNIVYCPERITQGYSILELQTLPQIVATLCEPQAYPTEVERLFMEAFPRIDIIRLPYAEAEYVKLFTNSHRYIQFALANEFYNICNDAGVDYGKIRKAMTYKYSRIPDLPTAGLAAGPCLLKDTQQLIATGEFKLGRAACDVNEGFPLKIVEQIESYHFYDNNTVALLGMAFKANIDDTRDSLSFKLKNLLEFKGYKVFCHDPYVPGYSTGLEHVYGGAYDFVVVCVNHDEYKNIEDNIDNSIVINPWKKI